MAAQWTVGGLTILHLADTRLEVIQGQVADLVFEVVEIHDAMSPNEKNLTPSIGTRARTGRGEREREGETSGSRGNNRSSWHRRWAPRRGGHVAAPELPAKHPVN